MRHRIALLALGALFVVPAFAQPTIATGRVPTVTRLVKRFSELEAGLATQARSADQAALDASLDPSFEMRVGGAPGTPVPRDEWIRETRAAAGRRWQIQQMAVHDLGDVALVSFRAVDASAASRHGARDRFVVDCWKRDGDGWKLAVRYLSDAPREGVGRSGSAKAIDKRY